MLLHLFGSNKITVFSLTRFPLRKSRRFLCNNLMPDAEVDKIQEEAANYSFNSSLPIFVVVSFTNSFRRQVKCIKYISICSVGGQRSGGCRYQASIQYISTSNSSNQDTKYNHDAQFTHGTTSQYRICLYWGYKRWRNIRQQRPHLLSYLTVGVLKTFYVCVVFRMCVHTHIHRLCVMLYCCM